MGVQYTPTGTAENLARQPTSMALYQAQNLNDNLQVGINYGGGVKWHFSDHIGARVDVRGLWTRNPTYGLPNSLNGTGVFIPARAKLDGLQATLGLVFYLGQSKCPPMPPAPPPQAPLPTPTISGAGGAGAVICPGKPVTVHADMPGAPADHKLTYAWTVNGQTQGGSWPDLTFTPGTWHLEHCSDRDRYYASAASHGASTEIPRPLLGTTAGSGSGGARHRQHIHYC